MQLKPIWNKLPTHWIEAGGLRDFRWVKGEGSDNVAALMTLTAICQHADQATGIAHLTYDELSEVLLLSRAKISSGIKLLTKRGLIDHEPAGQSTYRLAGYDPDKGWAKFPVRGLYQNGAIRAFSHFKLRQPAELEALKLFFLFVSRRDRKTNMAHIIYDEIETRSGVARNNIRRALSLLAANALVHVEYVPSKTSEFGLANAYRIANLDTYRHMGTTGRDSDLFH